jgi:molybdate transport system substrate-binding protein
VAMSLALSPAMNDGKRWEIPQRLYKPIEQGAVVLKSARNIKEAIAFLEYVKSAAGRKILEKYGFTVPRTVAAPTDKP